MVNKGVVQIKSLYFAFCPDGRPPVYSQWVSAACIPTEKLPVLGSVTHNKFSVDVDYEELQHQFDTLVYHKGSCKLAPGARDLNIPSGTYRQISAFTTIQEDFPRIYGLQPHGPAELDSSRSRIGEINQLKAYLLIFDQILPDNTERSSSHSPPTTVF